MGGCNYIGVEGHSRGCTVENCTVYVKGRKRKRALW
nr:MAG TPA: API3 pepsin inhibitor-3 [Caudoviricetes sp.]